MTIDPDRRDELTRRNLLDRGPGFGIHDVTPQQAAATAWAEQTERTIRELHAACEEYNGPDLKWLLWELPPPLRSRIERARAQLREAQARDGRNDSGARVVFYDDNGNKYDERKGWPTFNPDNPDHHTVPFGVMIWEPDTVHVLGGGTRERVTAPTPKWHQTPSDEARELGLDEMPDYGHAYDFQTFMHRADYQHAWRFCDMGLAEPGCGNGIGGGKLRVIAVPAGQYVWAIGVCETCIDALAEAQRDAHPNWREAEPQPYRPEVNIFYEAVYGKGRRRR